MRSLLSLALAALLLAPAASAQFTDPTPDEAFPSENVSSTLPTQAFGKAPWRVVYDHLSRSTTLFDARGEVREVWERLDGAPYAEVPTDRPVVVEVQNANALVYDYPVSAVVNEPLPAPRTCGGQGRQFVLAASLIAGQSFNPDSGLTSFSEGSTFRDFLNLSLGGVGTLLGSRSSRGFSASQLSRTVADAQDIVLSLQDAADRLGSAEQEVAASVERAASLGDVEPIDSLLVGVQRRLEQVGEGMSEPARVPVVAEQMLPDAGRALTSLFAAEQSILEGDTDSAVGPNADAVLQLATAARLATAEADEATNALQQLALRVERARAKTTQRTTVKPGDDLREVGITIRQNAWSTEQGIVGTRATERPLALFLAPRGGGGFGCSVAIAVTFAPRAPTYSFVDGQLVDRVSDGSEDGLGTAPAVLFEVAPPVVGKLVGAVGGVGLGQNLAPNLYAGGTLRLFSPILLIGGATWRRGDALPAGFSVGDTLDPDGEMTESEFLDGLEREWQRTFFFGISVVP